MPIIKSAIKRVRQTAVRTKRNNIIRRSYRELIKSFEKFVDDGKKADAVKLFPQVQKAIDLAAKKNILHNNTAGRMKSKLSKMINDGKVAAKKVA